jgi:carbon-monoxide dehydrogenase large subunit
MAVANSVFGASIKRREDPRLITGKGSFLDDVRLPGMLHVAVLRSAHAHARIKRIDYGKALGIPGVEAVVTGADFADVNPLPCAMPAGGVENKIATPRVLATDRVRHLGEGVAAVVASDPYTAHVALELIEVEYEPLPAVVDAEQALQPGAPQLHDDIPSNLVYHWTAGDEDATNAAFQQAEVEVHHRLRNQRLIPNAIEPRGAVGLYDPGADSYTLWATSQAPHVHRILVAAFVLGIPEHKLRVITPLDMGGGFGSKIFTYTDMPLVLVLARKLGRPVKWVETRRENYLATTHGRDMIHDIDVAAKRDGTVLGLRVRAIANVGAYLSTISPGVIATLYGRMVSGPYRIPAIWSEIRAVYTNTALVDAYRGAGRPEATYLLERTMDLLAHELGMDAAEVRRKNFIPPDAFPYTPPKLGMLPYDTGNYAQTLQKALEVVGYQELRREQEEGRKQGRLVGVGLSSYVEVCGVAPSAWIQKEGWGGPLWESAQIRVHATGKVQLVIGTLPHGQGHETTMAQVVAHELRIPMEDIEVLHGDTAGQAFGLGTYGSRSAAVGGAAVSLCAAKIREKVLRIGAHLLEVAPDDVEYRDGKVQVKGAPEQAKAFGDITLQAWLGSNLPSGEEPGLEASTFFDPPDCTFPFGTHAAVVEIDPETGQVNLRRYVAVDDVGPVINPMIVDGQVHGGIAQGVAQALFEGAVYGENGELMSGSMMDYAIPKASDLPIYETQRTVTPSPVNVLGVKGAGETGTIASTPAVVNAVVDALQPLGITNLDIPVTAERVWRAIQQKKAS